MAMCRTYREAELPRFINSSSSPKTSSFLKARKAVGSKAYRISLTEFLSGFLFMAFLFFFLNVAAGYYYDLP